MFAIGALLRRTVGDANQDTAPPGSAKRYTPLLFDVFDFVGAGPAATDPGTKPLAAKILIVRYLVCSLFFLFPCETETNNTQPASCHARLGVFGAVSPEQSHYSGVGRHQILI